MSGSLLIYDPVAQAGCANQELFRLESLSGKTVGFIDNGKPNFNFLVDDLAELLRARYGVAAIVKRRKRGPSVPAPDAIVNELAEQCDAVITGSGD